MEHVMSHAPGYDKLMKWTSIPIMPTPAAEGKMFKTFAETYNTNIIGVGLGGAPTNDYTIYKGRFVRTVSANLGMSYSICNVLKEAGIKNIIRWLPFKCDEDEIRNKLRNKMIRPTTIPQTLEDLIIEHAAAREAIRLAFEHHKFLARPLRGVKIERDIGSMFRQQVLVETYIEMLNINWIIGTGGLLSRAPRRAQSAMILIDAFQPEGVTKLAQDSVFMIPHLGVLSTCYPDIAVEIFEKDCLIRLGTCIAPHGNTDKDKRVLSLKVKMPNGNILNENVTFGCIKRIPLETNKKAIVQIKPEKEFDVGAGRGQSLETEVEGGVVGVIIDARGRPLILPEKNEERIKRIVEWYKSLDAYPIEFLDNR